MKHEWNKHEKDIYTTSKKPILIDMKPQTYFTIEGAVNPNSEEFGDYIEALYQISYAVRMSYKQEYKPDDYYEYKVYPLEGHWDLKDHSLYEEGKVNKDNLKFKLMIKQPKFVSQEFFSLLVDKMNEKKKAAKLLSEVELEEIEEGLCLQVLHLGSYDDEPATFKMMEEYAKDNSLKRICKTHKEIYISDARRTAPEKLKTILRFKVERV